MAKLEVAQLADVSGVQYAFIRVIVSFLPLLHRFLFTFHIGVSAYILYMYINVLGTYHIFLLSRKNDVMACKS